MLFNGICGYELINYRGSEMGSLDLVSCWRAIKAHHAGTAMGRCRELGLAYRRLSLAYQRILNKPKV